MSILKKAFVFIFLATCSSALYAQKGPVFQFKDKQDTHDFGKVKEGTKVEHLFEFTNVGDQPLQIIKVDASCGCTVPDWQPKTPILPGKTGSIKVVFNTQGHPGLAYKEVTIKSNAVLPDKSKERYTVVLKGEVVK